MTRFKGQWFYIDNADIQSKRVFALLLYLFEAMAPAADQKGPLLTLPTG